MKRLAIIPARGGSKRIPQKNIRDFCGKPIISYILDAAKASNLFDIIHVSTDDNKIYDIVSNLGFQPDFKRQHMLADDETPIMPVLKFVTDTFKSKGVLFTEIWLLMACAPLIESKDLKQAAALYSSHNGHYSVLTVSEYAAPIEWAFDLDKQGKLLPVQPGEFATPSNSIKPKYHDTGSFAIFPATKITSSKGAGDDQNFIGHVLPREKGIDIDSQENWDIAEAIFQFRNNLAPRKDIHEP